MVASSGSTLVLAALGGMIVGIDLDGYVTVGGSKAFEESGFVKGCVACCLMAG